MSKMETLRELWGFLKKRKVYWLAPILIVLLLLGALILLPRPRPWLLSYILSSDLALL